MSTRTSYREDPTFADLDLSHSAALRLLQHARDHVGRAFLYDHYTHGEYAAAMVTLFECERRVRQIAMDGVLVRRALLAPGGRA